MSDKIEQSDEEILEKARNDISKYIGIDYSFGIDHTGIAACNQSSWSVELDYPNDSSRIAFENMSNKHIHFYENSYIKIMALFIFGKRFPKAAKKKRILNKWMNRIVRGEVW